MCSYAALNTHCIETSPLVQVPSFVTAFVWWNNNQSCVLLTLYMGWFIPQNNTGQCSFKSHAIISILSVQQACLCERSVSRRIRISVKYVSVSNTYQSLKECVSDVQCYLLRIQIVFVKYIKYKVFVKYIKYKIFVKKIFIKLYQNFENLQLQTLIFL